MSSENLPVSDEDGDLLVASVSVITVQESAEGDGGAFSGGNRYTNKRG
jgi:hypothetical protein